MSIAEHPKSEFCNTYRTIYCESGGYISESKGRSERASLHFLAVFWGLALFGLDVQAVLD